jgi:hypothetical protein
VSKGLSIYAVITAGNSKRPARDNGQAIRSPELFSAVDQGIFLSLGHRCCVNVGIVDRVGLLFAVLANGFSLLFHVVRLGLQCIGTVVCGTLYLTTKLIVALATASGK